jgi:anti-sigma factor RsiW
MNCKKVLSRLHAYLDEEMPVKLIREMEEHVSCCPSCRSQVARIRQVSDLLDSLTVPPMPQEFAARVMSEARRMAPLAKDEKSLFPLGWQRLRWLLDLSVPMRIAACAMVLLACLLGRLMSKELSLSWNRRALVAEAENLDGFEWFSPTPPASLGAAYLTLASTSTQDQGAR